MSASLLTPPRYVVVTAARNEAAYIELTLRSVIAQTVRPVRWVIVSDGSTDETDAIVKRHAAGQPWIQLLRMPERTERHFGAKAVCVNTAYATLGSVAFDFVVNLDADVSFDPGYFEFVLSQFQSDTRLGVAGTPYVEGEADDTSHSRAHGFAELQHVSGPCQVFRRVCFEAIGGYVPLKDGAVDWVAVRTARMKGWRTHTFVGRTYRHHRKMGTAECGVLRSNFRYGMKAYRVGGHPVWELLRGGFQMRKQPWIAGGLCFQAGFVWAALSREARVVSPELMAFHRQEQLQRLRGFFRRPRPTSGGARNGGAVAAPGA